MGLHENAAAMAGRDHTAAAEPAATPSYAEPDVGDLTVDAEQVPAVIAWSRVMGEVRAIGKHQQFDGGRAGRFQFRGVDAALNSFGPACRKHGVVVVPHRVETAYRDISTKSGGSMRECSALVTFRIYGPAGDHFEAQAAGEASDSGGRSTPKAQSIALRTLLLSAGLVPTEDRDADAVHFERGEAAPRPLTGYRDEALNPATSKGRMAQMLHELRQQGRTDDLVINETGDEERIGVLIYRVGNERGFGGAA